MGLRIRSSEAALPPSWMDDGARTFEERVEMLACAYACKHGRIPVVVYEDGREHAYMRAAIDHESPAPEQQMSPEKQILVQHIGRAWDRWTGGLDPDTTRLSMFVCPSGIVVAIEPRTPIGAPIRVDFRHLAEREFDFKKK
jgi:hypothetical protein